MRMETSRGNPLKGDVINPVLLLRHPLGRLHTLYLSVVASHEA
jgi:hypothetical protein